MQHRHRLTIALSLTALFLCAASAGASDPASGGDAIRSVSGSVELGRGEPVAWREAQVGQVLGGGDVVRTGADGRAELQIDGTTVRLYEGSLLRLPKTKAAASDEVSRVTRLQLDKGRSLFDVIRRSGRQVEIETSEVVVSVKGTRFSVDAAAHRVAVFRGTVGVRDAAAVLEELIVREGFAAALGAEGPLELLTNAGADPWAGWSEGGALPASLSEHGFVDSGAHGRARAIEAARAQAKPQAVERAIARRPELRAKVEREMAKRKGQANGKANGRRFDPVSDDKRKKIKQKVAGEYAQLLANGGGPTGGTNSNLMILFSPGTGAGGDDQVKVEDTSSGFVAFFDEDFIEFLDGGLATLPPTLLAGLTANGVNVEAFIDSLVLVLEAGN